MTTMPSKSAAQHRLMEAAAHTPGGYGGVPQKVGQDFAAADLHHGSFHHTGRSRANDGHTTSGLDHAMQLHADSIHPVKR